MECVAIIAEFNPFHNGHAWLVKKVRERFPEHTLLAVMSGNTVQRGDIAVFDKYERARTAIENGFDLVLELPFPFSCSAAEQFATASVSIANSVGASVLAFGSECGDIDMLCDLAEKLSAPDFLAYLDEYTAKNRETSAIMAKSSAFLTVYGKELPEGGNDMLALEYIRAIRAGMYPMTPYAVHRTENFRATDARAALRTGNVGEIERLLPNGAPSGSVGMSRGLNGLSGLILGALRLGYCKDNGNGIVNALQTCAERAGSFEGFISMLPTKTYTMARLRREMMAALFSVSDADKNEAPEYTVLLGASKRGTSYLSEHKKSIRIPVLSRIADARNLGERGRAQLEKAIRADNVCDLSYPYPMTPMPFKTPYIGK